MNLPTILPGEKAGVEIPYEALAFQSTKEVYLTVSLTLKHSTTWAPIGHEVAWAQHRLQTSSPTPANHPVLDRPSSALNVSAKGSQLKVSGDDFVFEFDRARGGLKTWTSNGQMLLSANPDDGMAIIPSFWRPGTDNDVPVSQPYWRRFGVDALTSQLRSISVQESTDSVVFKARTFMTPPVLDWGWDCEVEYTVTATGTLIIDVVRLAPTGSFPSHVPRIGLNMHAAPSLSQVRWLGLGPGESYPDKKSAQRVGVWSFGSVEELHTPYDVPQENGNRLETRWLALRDGRTGEGLRVSRLDDAEGSGKGFSFAASRYSDRTVQEARHPPDLVKGDYAVFVRVDAEVAGVGTAACGPGVRDDLLVKSVETGFKIKIEKI